MHRRLSVLVGERGRAQNPIVEHATERWQLLCSCSLRLLGYAHVLVPTNVETMKPEMTRPTKNSALKEHCERLNAKMGKLEEEVERSKEQVATLTRRLEKSRSQNAKLVEQVKESVKTTNEQLNSKLEDNEMRDAELGELRKVGGYPTVRYSSSARGMWNKRLAAFAIPCVPLIHCAMAFPQTTTGSKTPFLV